MLAAITVATGHARVSVFSSVGSGIFGSLFIGTSRPQTALASSNSLDVGCWMLLAHRASAVGSFLRPRRFLRNNSIAFPHRFRFAREIQPQTFVPVRPVVRQPKKEI